MFPPPDLRVRRKTSGGRAVVTCDYRGSVELIGYVAAKANHEQNPWHQRRTDDAFAAGSAAALLKPASSPKPPTMAEAV